MVFQGQQVTGKDRAAMRALRKDMQLIFQDPFGSLSPRMTVGQIISEGLLVHEPSLSAKDRDLRACKALEEVSLDPAMRNRYPHEFSGGQRQRIAIARTMVLKPELVVLDEPTSALDRTIQKQVVELLRDLQKTLRSDLSVHQPRPCCCAGPVRYGHGDAARQGGRSRDGRRYFRSAAMRLHQGVDWRGHADTATDDGKCLNVALN